ncbi:probable N-acetylglucosaminyl-phosphatidylinositol de-N-acetylase isoform X1 [Ananas comosus]|uniref:N-acetylglucosaminylphosphatidylinositol deacetylase n=1 Tax=Ananas comosus TaxID=4615 RepID=A0A6P5EEP3_ANACO|nr:probable N-acetylglucosaminyl-phosphatidylinositol de-N-acetylase isoform X1 [Ananas comosus]
MAWISLIPLALISLWGLSLWRLLCSSSSSRSVFLSNGSGKRRNVLLVVAHPDDESMFFAPTILFLVSKGHNLHILCMSLGNADGMGNIRKEEFYRACAVLKVVPLEHIKVLDHPNLQDGFDKKWDHQLLAGLIEDQIKMWDIDSVITFDNFGVSGHPNHRDVHHGICKLLHGNSQRKIEAWELVSVNIFRKYSGPVDIWLSTLLSLSYDKQHICCLRNSNPRRSYDAMAQHESQWVWFRKLFILLSSYTYINMLRKVKI